MMHFLWINGCLVWFVTLVELDIQYFISFTERVFCSSIIDFRLFNSYWRCCL